MAANPELRAQLEGAISENKVLLLMKGTPDAPRCGFSMRAVGILEQMGTEYGAIDGLPVLQPRREVTTEFADWQTFPQLYVDGELLGGADLMEEMLQSGVPFMSRSTLFSLIAPNSRARSSGLAAICFPPG